MAQEAFIKLTNEWTALSDTITVDEEATYYLQNRGADVLLAQEAGETPTSDDVNGVLVKPYEVAKYKENGGDLYLRAYSSNCSVNITSDKTQTGGETWLDITYDATASVDSEEGTFTTVNTIDDYEVTVVWNIETNTYTLSVEKDGEPVDTASLWLVSEDKSIKLDLSTTPILFTLENSFEYGESMDEGYYGTLSLETDVEEDVSNWIAGEAYHDGEASPALYPMVKL